MARCGPIYTPLHDNAAEERRRMGPDMTNANPRGPSFSSVPIVAAAAVSGLAALWMMAQISGGECTATMQLFPHPWDALTGTPWPEDPDFYGINDSPCRGWPSMLETWLSLWIPLLFVLGVTGALASRLGAAPSATRGAIAAGLAAAIAVLSLYVPELVSPSRMLIVWLGVIVIAGATGFLGGYFVVRQRSASTRT
jgi:hypothetical protein